MSTSTPAYPPPEAYSDTIQHGLELGADARGERVCVLEVAPFATREEAKAFAEKHRGAVASHVREAAEAAGMEADEMDAEDGDHILPIVGATVYDYSDRYGTSESIDLY